MPAATSASTSARRCSGLAAWVAGSMSILRRASAPSPATRHAFSTDECVCADVYTANCPLWTPLCSVLPPLTRCSAATSATRVASDAVCWMTPLPRKAEQRGEPVEYVRLELGRGRGGRPEHVLYAEF